MAEIKTTIYTYALEGEADFRVNFEYLSRKYVYVTLRGDSGFKNLTLNRDFYFVDTNLIRTNKIWTSKDGYERIEIRRVTPSDVRLVDYKDGSVLTASYMNISYVQSVHVAEEARDLASYVLSLNLDGNLDARGRKIVNLGSSIPFVDTEAASVGTVRQLLGVDEREAKIARKSIEQLRTSEPTLDRQEVDVVGYYEGAVRGGGTFWYDASDSISEDNGVTVIVTPKGARWKRKFEHLYPEDFGVKGNGTDETTLLQKAIEFTHVNNIELRWYGNARYKASKITVMNEGSTKWVVEGEGTVVLESIKDTPEDTNYDADHFIKIGGAYVGSFEVTKLDKAKDVVNMSDNSSVEIGSLIELSSTHLINTDNRGQAREGQITKVLSKIRNNGLGISDNLMFSFKPYIQNGTLQEGSNSTKLILDSSINKNKYEMMIKITMTSGASSGQSRYITEWDNSKKVATIGGKQSGFSSVSAGDSFTLSLTCVVKTYKKAIVNIDGPFLLTRARQTNARAGDLGFRGLDIYATLNSKLKGIIVHNFSDTGIRVRGCYNTTIENCTVSYANRAYSTDLNQTDGTGYGFSDTQSSYSTYRNCIATHCRRGFDTIGTQAYDTYCTFDSCRVFSGGLTYTGVGFFPDGAYQTSGLGSHGGGYATTYVNCEVHNVTSGFNHRGHNGVMKGCKHYGAATYGITMYYANGLNVSDYIYDDLSYTTVDKASASYSPLLETKRMAVFLNIWSDQIKTDLPIVLNNITTTSCRSGFIYIDRVGTVPDIFMGGCTVYLEDNLSASKQDTTWVFKKEQRTTLGRITETSQNNMIFPDKLTNFHLTKGWDNNLFKGSKGGYVKMYDGTYRCFVPAKGVIKIPMTQDGLLNIDIVGYIPNRPFKGQGILLQAVSSGGGDESVFKETNKINIDLIKEIPTGETGRSSKISLAYKPSGTNYLYVQNSYSTDYTFNLTVR